MGVYSDPSLKRHSHQRANLEGRQTSLARTMNVFSPRSQSKDMSLIKSMIKVEIFVRNDILIREV